MNEEKLKRKCFAFSENETGNGKIYLCSAINPVVFNHDGCEGCSFYKSAWDETKELYMVHQTDNLDVIIKNYKGK